MNSEFQREPVQPYEPRYNMPSLRVPLDSLAARLLNCCLSVVLQLDKEDYPENSHIVFCPNKYRYFEPFMCLDLAAQLCTFCERAICSTGSPSRMELQYSLVVRL